MNKPYTRAALSAPPSSVSRFSGRPVATDAYGKPLWMRAERARNSSHSEGAGSPNKRAGGE